MLYNLETGSRGVTHIAESRFTADMSTDGSSIDILEVHTGAVTVSITQQTVDAAARFYE